MPYPSTHKFKTRQRILSSAAKLFSQQGFEQISIDQVMADAGLTRGAFYNHFADKSALYAEALNYAAKHRLSQYQQTLAFEHDLHVLVNSYLSYQHVKQTEIPCPLAFLVTDVSQRDPQVRQTYTHIFKGMLQRLRKFNPQQTNPENYLTALTLMIGGVAISRALDDQDLILDLLQACKNTSLDLLAAPKA